MASASGGETAYFEHHNLLWKNPTINIGMKPKARSFLLLWSCRKPNAGKERLP